jgi:predicted nucleic acid-binding protein
VIFIDTSAFYAIVSKSDQNHSKAIGILKGLIQAEERLITTNYVLLESTTLIQRRLGLKALKSFVATIEKSMEIFWIGETEHKLAYQYLLSKGDRDLSLVDCASFLLLSIKI